MIRNSNPEQMQDTLLQLVRQLSLELHPQTEDSLHLSLDSSLDRDLGLDSLARVELLTRLEQSFTIRLSEQVLITADTPRDLLRHLQYSASSTQPQESVIAAVPVSPATDVISLPYTATTLVEVLDSHVESEPDCLHIVLDSGTTELDRLTYGDLRKDACRLAAGLQQHGLYPGETVAIMLPTGMDYFRSFFAVLLAGGIPVPLYPPQRPTQIEEHMRRHRGIVDNAQAKLLITMPEVKPVAKLLQAQTPSLVKIGTCQEFCDKGEAFIPIPIQTHDTAFLQYTSGSTGDPKGVVLSHANLLANLRAMGKTIHASAGDVFVSWLPLYHDMGLIGAWLGSLYYGCRLIILPPLSFLARPERWLWAIHRHRGTLSASPNFGYEFCTRRIADPAIEGLDLSSWRLAFNGAEPVSPATIKAFEERFAAYGYKKEATSPVYGLAESSVGLAFTPPGRGALIDIVDRNTFLGTGLAISTAENDKTTLKFVACGQPLPGHQIRIVDSTGRELPERQEGRLQFKGPSVTDGYFRNPDQTRALFHGEWLESGDLAYIAAGDIFITSRVKDIIIRAGRNIYPHELEEAIGNINGIRKGCVAVFGGQDPQNATERVIILAESRKKEAGAKEELRKLITGVAVDLLGMPADDIVIAPPGTILKTSSGKIRRAACRALYEQDRIGKGKQAVWLQLVRLAISGVIPRLHKVLRRLTGNLYALSCWFLFGLIGVPLWLLVATLPFAEWRWRLVRQATKTLSFFSGTRITVKGNIPQKGPFVLTANHLSYLDGLVLVAALPIECTFVAKAELADNFILRVMLSRLEVIFVERFDFAQGLEDTRRIGRLVASGKHPIFFPEGTLQRMPGLLPFHMGAFVIAVQADIPVVPVTIRGTRNKLRADSWIPRPGRVSVIIGPPVAPVGSGWPAALSLRDTVRKEILRHCGEPDLAGAYTSLAQMEIERPQEE